MIAPSTAARLGLANEDVVEIQYRNRTVNAPVLGPARVTRPTP